MDDLLWKFASLKGPSGINFGCYPVEDKVCRFDLGTAAAVQRRLLLTAEGIALRRLCYQLDAFQAYESFLWA